MWLATTAGTGVAQRASRGRGIGGGQRTGNPVPIVVVSTMSNPIPDLHTSDMPPSTGSPSGDLAPPDWQQVQTLRVADVVMTILKARKAMPSATAATVSRMRHGDGYRVLVNLMEEGPAPGADGGHPGGIDEAVAIFIARELGKDLADAFGSTDVIILQ